MDWHFFVTKAECVVTCDEFSAVYGSFLKNAVRMRPWEPGPTYILTGIRSS